MAGLAVVLHVVDLAVDLLEEVEAEQQQRRRGRLCSRRLLRLLGRLLQWRLRRRVHKVPDREQAWVVGGSAPLTQELGDGTHALERSSEPRGRGAPLGPRGQPLVRPGP